MKESIRKANQYIDENRKVDQQYRGSISFAPSIGWMNDPNGCLFPWGNTICFYQFYPMIIGTHALRACQIKKISSIREELPVTGTSESYDKDSLFLGVVLL